MNFRLLVFLWHRTYGVVFWPFFFRKYLSASTKKNSVSRDCRQLLRLAIVRANESNYFETIRLASLGSPELNLKESFFSRSRLYFLVTFKFSIILASACLDRGNLSAICFGFMRSALARHSLQQYPSMLRVVNNLTAQFRRADECEMGWRTVNRRCWAKGNSSKSMGKSCVRWRQLARHVQFHGFRVPGDCEKVVVVFCKIYHAFMLG